MNKHSTESFVSYEGERLISSQRSLRETSEEDEQLYPADFDILKERAKEYIVTPRGMLGSKRKAKGDILIGRS